MHNDDWNTVIGCNNIIKKDTSSGERVYVFSYRYMYV